MNFSFLGHSGQSKRPGTWPAHPLFMSGSSSYARSSSPHVFQPPRSLWFAPADLTSSSCLPGPWNSISVQFSSVAQSCLTLCHPVNSSMPVLPVHHQLAESTQTMSIELVMPSNHLILCLPFSSCPLALPASGSFPISQLFASGGQRIGASIQHQSFQ